MRRAVVYTVAPVDSLRLVMEGEHEFSMVRLARSLALAA